MSRWKFGKDDEMGTPVLDGLSIFDFYGMGMLVMALTHYVRTLPHGGDNSLAIFGIPGAIALLWGLVQLLVTYRQTREVHGAAFFMGVCGGTLPAGLMLLSMQISTGFLEFALWAATSLAGMLFMSRRLLRRWLKAPESTTVSNPA